jgi:hypothetical protein
MSYSFLQKVLAIPVKRRKTFFQPFSKPTLVRESNKSLTETANELFDFYGQPLKEIFEHFWYLVLRGPEIIRHGVESLGQTEKFKVRNPTQLRLDFGESFPAQVPSPTAAPRSQHRLRQPLLVAQSANLRPNEISWIAHVPKPEHEARKMAETKGSEFRTLFACQEGGLNQE